MKPRIKLINRLWYCWTYGKLLDGHGIGYTPSEAYAEWMSIQRVKALRA